jgi:hypothetical protein
MRENTFTDEPKLAAYSVQTVGSSPYGNVTVYFSTFPIYSKQLVQHEHLKKEEELLTRSAERRIGTNV